MVPSQLVPGMFKPACLTRTSRWHTMSVYLRQLLCNIVEDWLCLNTSVEVMFWETCIVEWWCVFDFRRHSQRCSILEFYSVAGMFCRQWMEQLRRPSSNDIPFSVGMRPGVRWTDLVRPLGCMMVEWLWELLSISHITCHYKKHWVLCGQSSSISVNHHLYSQPMFGPKGLV